jgi:molybdopterin synthase catalytic subunit
MLELTEQVIDTLAQLTSLNHDIGCSLQFFGIVRNAPEDKDVKGIDYSAFAKMCFTLWDSFESSMKEKHPSIRINVIHRLGYVPVGGISLLVNVYAPHRLDTFQVMEEVVEWIKKNLAVWKKVIYLDDVIEWKGNDGSTLR